MDATSAVLLASKYCRQNPLFQWNQISLTCSGQRPYKYRFQFYLSNLLHEKERAQSVVLTLLPVSMTSFNERKSERTVYEHKALLVSLQHPHILPTLDLSLEKNAVLLIQPWSAAGSLKDWIYHNALPENNYEVKYAGARGRALQVEEISRIGSQILEALTALRAHDIILEHLHSGNVILEKNCVRLAEVYNTILNLDRLPRAREIMTPLETTVEPDLLQFGHVIYEMATGVELAAPRPDVSILNALDPLVSELLRFVFHRKKTEPVTIEAIKSCKLFEHDSRVDTSIYLDSRMQKCARAAMLRNTERNARYLAQYRREEEEREMALPVRRSMRGTRRKSIR